MIITDAGQTSPRDPRLHPREVPGAKYVVLNPDEPGSWTQIPEIPPGIDRSHRIGRWREEWRLLKELNHPDILYPEEVVPHQDNPLAIFEDPGLPELTRLLKRSERPPLHRALALVERLGLLLREVHHQCLVHLNLNPMDIYGDEVNLKVGGWALHPLSGERPSNPELALMRYRAPEQFSGRAPDHRADIYSLGLILYQLITGVHPLGTPRGGIRLAWQSIAGPRVWNPDVDEALDRLCLSALAWDPRERPATMDHFLEALRHTSHGETLAFTSTAPPFSRVEELDDDALEPTELILVADDTEEFLDLEMDVEVPTAAGHSRLPDPPGSGQLHLLTPQTRNVILPSRRAALRRHPLGEVHPPPVDEREAPTQTWVDQPPTAATPPQPRTPPRTGWSAYQVGGIVLLCLGVVIPLEAWLLHRVNDAPPPHVPVSVPAPGPTTTTVVSSPPTAPVAPTPSQEDAPPPGEPSPIPTGLDPVDPGPANPTSPSSASRPASSSRKAKTSLTVLADPFALPPPQAAMATPPPPPPAPVPTQPLLKGLTPSTYVGGARVTAVSDGQEVYVWWRAVGGTYTRTKLNKNAGGQFQGEIPAGEATRVEYWLEATGEGGARTSLNERTPWVIDLPPPRAEKARTRSKEEKVDFPMTF